MIVVLDTNVLASGFVAYRFGLTSSALILRAWLEGLFVLLVSDRILTELQRTLGKPYFAQHPRSVSRDWAAEMLRTAADFVELQFPLPRIASHIEDDAVIATAVQGGADYLVTGDQAQLRLERVEGIRIVSPADFVRILTERRGSDDG